MTKKPETVKEEDLIVGEDGLYYKKNTKVAFKGNSEEFFEKGQLKDRKNRKKEKLDGLWKTFFAGVLQYHARVVLKVLANTRQINIDINAVIVEMLRRTDPREHQ